MLQIHAELSLPLPIKVLFDSWRSSPHHLWDHSSRQCQQLWRQQSLVSTIPPAPEVFVPCLCVTLFDAEVDNAL